MSMQVRNRLLHIAALMAAAMSLAACTSVSLDQDQSQRSASGFYPLPPVETRPPPPTLTPPPSQPPAKAAMFLRPAPGQTIFAFDGTRNKGIDIDGNLGDPIIAAADGRVIYVGGELPDYGNMVIIKHNDTYLTAYAHAKTILVKENEVVRQGQKIAEIGNSGNVGAGRPLLHFEIRKQGTAVDPEPYLSGKLP